MDNNNEYCILDIETTGFSAKKDKITEIGVIRVSGDKVIDTFDELVNPQIKIPFHIKNITNITDDMVSKASTINEVLPKLINFVGNTPVVAHNAKFDVRFIKYNANQLGYDFNNKYIDTCYLAKKLFPEYDSHKLNDIANNLNIKVDNKNNVLDGVKTLNKVFDVMLKKMDIKNINQLVEENNSTNNEK